MEKKRKEVKMEEDGEEDEVGRTWWEEWQGLRRWRWSGEWKCTPKGHPSIFELPASKDHPLLLWGSACQSVPHPNLPHQPLPRLPWSFLKDPLYYPKTRICFVVILWMNVKSMNVMIVKCYKNELAISIKRNCYFKRKEYGIFCRCFKLFAFWELNWEIDNYF